ncbi:hypothetical protein ACFX13_003396 [Malus domestica]
MSADRALQWHNGGKSSIVIEEIGKEGTDGNILKRGAEPSDMDIIKSSHKRSKNSDSRVERKQRMADRLRSISIKERCLMMERALLVEKELEEIPEEFFEMWEYMEEVSEAERTDLMARKRRKTPQGSGNWPDTAVRLP